MVKQMLVSPSTVSRVLFAANSSYSGGFSFTFCTNCSPMTLRSYPCPRGT